MLPACGTGGKISGRLMMSNGEGTGIMQAKLAADQVDVGDLVWKRGGQPVATGKASFTAALETTGRSMDEIAHSATGSGELRLSVLSVEGVNTAMFAPLLGSADKLQGDITADKVRPLVSGLVRNGAATIGSVTIPFNIGGGEIRVQNVQAKAGAVKLAGEGRFDPVDDIIDADLAMTFDPGEDTVAGGDPTVSLTYGGRLSAPSERIDVGAISNFLSLRHFEQERRRVETLQASVLEKQRLRREVAYYNALAVDRQAARLKAEADEKARQAAAAAAERQRLDAEAAAAKAQQQQQQQQQQQPAEGAGQGNAGQGNATGQGSSGQPAAPSNCRRWTSSSLRPCRVWAPVAETCPACSTEALVLGVPERTGSDFGEADRVRLIGSRWPCPCPCPCPCPGQAEHREP